MHQKAPNRILATRDQDTFPRFYGFRGDAFCEERDSSIHAGNVQEIEKKEE